MMPAVGPTTEAGKAASSRNAVKHGILSEAPLVTPLETAGDWQSHLRAVRESIAPRDHLETCLAERVALLLWRMRRLACAEVEAIAWSQHRVANDYQTEEFDGYQPSRVYEYVARLRKAETLCELWTSVWEAPEEQWLDGERTADLLKQAIELGGINRDQVPPGLHPYRDWTKEVWTAGRLRTCLDWIVTTRELDPEQFRARCSDYFDEQVRIEKAVISEVEDDLDRMARRRMLPPETEMHLQTRYESHLGRELSRTMRVLKDLQARPAASTQSQISTLQSPINNGGHREERPLDGSTPFQLDSPENCETNSDQPIEETPILQHSMTPADSTEPSGQERSLAQSIAENCETNSIRELTPEELDASFYPPAPTEEQLKGLNSGQLASVGHERIRIYLENKRRYEESLQATRKDTD